MSTRHKVGCTGKQHFERFGQADKAATRRNRQDGGAHLEAYHCKHCNGFHIGEARSYRHRDQRKEAREDRDDSDRRDNRTHAKD